MARSRYADFYCADSSLDYSKGDKYIYAKFYVYSSKSLFGLLLQNSKILKH